MSVITKTNQKEFSGLVAPAFNEYQRFFVVFKGSVDPETGINWCSDCVIAEDVQKEHLFKTCEKDNIPVYNVEVGLRTAWKDLENPARIHPVFRVAGVPCVCLVEDGSMVAKLEEENLFNPKVVAAMIEEY